jgi:polysaccharide export outer membrane protein
VKVALLIAGSIWLASCSANGSSKQRISAMPSTLPSDGVTALSQQYLVGPLDKLSITVFNEPELSFKDIPVDPNGYITMPLIGEIRASGRPVSDVASEIQEKLNLRFIRNARVNAYVSDFANYSFTVDGEVTKPGVYQIPGTLTLSQAIAFGEGASEFAKLDEVIILRNINGQIFAARFDLADIYSGAAADPEIRKHDTIIVGFSAAKKRLKDVLQVIPGVAGIFVALIQRP